MRRWPSRIRGAGGSRTHSKLLCRQPPCRLAPAPRYPVSSPGVEPGPRPSQGRVQVPHTPRTFFSAPCRGIEPRLAVSRTAVLLRYTCRASVSTRNRTRAPTEGWSWTFGGSYAIRCTIETQNVPTWSRTRARALGVPCAIRYTIGTCFSRSRADDWTCTSMTRFTKPPPRYSATSAYRKQEREDSNPVGRLWRPLPLPGGHSSIGPGLAAGDGGRNDYSCNVTLQ